MNMSPVTIKKPEPKHTKNLPAYDVMLALKSRPYRPEYPDHSGPCTRRTGAFP